MIIRETERAKFRNHSLFIIISVNIDFTNQLHKYTLLISLSLAKFTRFVDSFYRLSKLSTCNVLIKEKQTNFRACFVTKDITNDNLVNWLTEFETINNVSLKIKTNKKQTAGYVLENYYRCHLQYAKMESI